MQADLELAATAGNISLFTICNFQVNSLAILVIRFHDQLLATALRNDTVLTKVIMLSCGLLLLALPHLTTAAPTFLSRRSAHQ